MCQYRCALIDASAVMLRTLCNAFIYKCNMLARLEYDQNEAYSKQVQTVCFIRQSMQKEGFWQTKQQQTQHIANKNEQNRTFYAEQAQSAQKWLNWCAQSEQFKYIWNFQNASFCLFWSIPPYIVTRGRISYKFHTNGKIYKRKRKEEGIAIFYSILFSPSVNSTQGAENSQTEQLSFTETKPNKIDWRVRLS